jgi:hypothetical protein
MVSELRDRTKIERKTPMDTTKRSITRRLILAISILALGLACTCLPLARSDKEPDREITAEKATTPSSSSGDKEETIPIEKATPTPDTLVVRSFPPGQEVYVVPEKVAQGTLGTASLTAEKYFVGHTPLEIALEAGTYHVSVKHEPARFLDDGVDDTVFLLIEGDENKWMPTARIYYVTKSPDHQAMVTALLWPEGQSSEEFVATLPKDELFDISKESFEQVLQRHHIPEEDWDLLLTMLRRTGKAVWYGKDPSDYLFIYLVEPDRMEAKWGGIATP